MRPSTIAATLTLLTLALPAMAQLPPEAAQALADPPVVRAIRADRPIAIDGRLDEAIWAENEPFELPFETRPVIGGPAPVRTFAWIAFDDENVYFAFRAEDPDPAAIRARYADRDTTFRDDQVGVIFDTFHDGRRAFEFFVNPFGIQSDVLEDDVTGGDDPTWDAIWDSAGRITAFGYVVEAAVPFTSLRFPRADGEQLWGFNAVRFYPRDSTRRLALMPRDPARNCILCQLAELGGLEGPEPGLDLELDPTLTATRTDDRRDDPDGPYASGGEDAEAGLTLRWGITPNIIFNSTFNPDFSQVEADAQQLEVNTQFALFFPEKRPFFLEGADLFDTTVEAVYTRNLAEPNVGLKLTGKEGAHAFGLLVADDEITNLLIPGPEGSRLTEVGRASSAAVARYRRDLPWTGSTAGLLFTRRAAGEYENTVGGADARVRFARHHSLRVELFGSRTRYTDEVVEELDQPEGRFDGHVATMAYDYSADEWAGYARYHDLGAGFRADLGFEPRVDYRQAILGLERIWRGDGDDWYNEVRFGGDYDEAERQNGDLLERELEVWWSYQGPLDTELRALVGSRERAFRGVEFDETFFYARWAMVPTSTVSFTVEAYAGDEIDVANVRAGDTLVLDPSVTLKLGRHVDLSLSHSFERLEVDAGRLYEANLSRLALRYQLNARTQVRLISQYLDVDRDPTLYLDPVEARTEQLAQQLLFSWKLNPQTVVFAGYSDTSVGDASLDLTRVSRTFFFKLGYAWLP